MELRFLGVGAAYFPVLNNNAAYFLSDRTAFLLDCGGTVFPKMMEVFPWDQMDELVVLVTHLHADHTGSLGTLLSYSLGVRRMGVTVVHPRKELQELIRLVGIHPSRYSFAQTGAFERAGIRVAFIDVIHSSGMPCYALLLESQKERVYYSGDAADIPPQVLKDFLGGRVQRLYQDCSFLAKEKGGHALFEELRCSIPPAHRHRMFPMHWDCHAEQLIVDAGFGLIQMAEPTHQ